MSLGVGSILTTCPLQKNLQELRIRDLHPVDVSRIEILHHLSPELDDLSQGQNCFASTWRMPGTPETILEACSKTIGRKSRGRCSTARRILRVTFAVSLKANTSSLGLPFGISHLS
jgi:hypothetical protein